MALTSVTTFRGAPGRATHHRQGRSRRPAWPTARAIGGRRHGQVGDVGLPEVVGFAIGAGVMATALAALEAGLAGNERARRLARDGGVRAELERAAADRGWQIPLPRDAPAEETAATPTDGRRQKSWASS
jgi:hypothetical protein